MTSWKLVALACPYCGRAFPIDADTIDAVRDHVSDCGDDAAG